MKLSNIPAFATGDRWVKWFSADIRQQCALWYPIATQQAMEREAARVAASNAKRKRPVSKQRRVA